VWSNRWLNGELWFHFHVRVRPRLAHVDPVNFCADLKRLGANPLRDSGDHTIPRLFDIDPSALRDNEDWANCSVLVFAGERGERPKNMQVESSLPHVVRLAATDDCDVCPPNAGQLGVRNDLSLFVPLGDQRAIESRSRSGDRKVDRSQLPATQAIGGRLKMIECVAWEPLPECVGRPAAPLDSRSKGVIRRTIPKHEFDKFADRTNYMLTPATPQALPGQSGRFSRSGARPNPKARGRALCPPPHAVTLRRPDPTVYPSAAGTRVRIGLGRSPPNARPSPWQWRSSGSSRSRSGSPSSSSAPS
jgi:hypothetical protein